MMRYVQAQDVFGFQQVCDWDEACAAVARSTCGLVAMTSASHAEGRQLDPGQVYYLALSTPLQACAPSIGQGGARPRGLARPRDAASRGLAAGLRMADIESVYVSYQGINDPGRTRTCNLWFRRPTPYPLGHRTLAAQLTVLKPCPW